ncbi:MAG: efflux RND transporter periplasmic adaptor subunit [Gemmatimonadota bacterium]
MKSASIAAVALLLGTACSGRRPSTDAASPVRPDSMAGMAGMAGMAMPAASTNDSGAVPIDRAAAARAGITFARASVRSIGTSALLAGTLAYPEPSRRVVTVRVNGWVQQLFANYVGMAVRAGDPLFTLYSPEVVGAEEEYLSAKRLSDPALLAASRRRLELLDVPEREVSAVDSAGVVPKSMLVRASSNGEVAAKMITAGQAVRSGDSLLVLADRATLWLNVVVHEMDAGQVRVGSPVIVTVRSLTERHWTGRFAFIQPTADSMNRTLTARVEIQNPDGALRPGMYAMIDATSGGSPVLSVPASAVLPTGRRNLVFVNRGNDRFEPREVQVGARGDSLIQVVSGLKAGDEVVASATYLIDSESSLAAAMQGLMLQMGMGSNPSASRAPAKDRKP